MLINLIRERVLELCQAPENRLTPAFFDEHLLVVAHYARELADKLNADPEMVELASYLHDISAVRDFNSLPTHAVDSSTEAGAILAEYKYPPEKIGVVQIAIGLHALPLKVGEGSPEAVCLSNADAIAQIANPAYWLFFAYRIRNLDFAEGRQWYLNRVMQSWNAMIPEARALIEPQYQNVLNWIQP